MEVEGKSAVVVFARKLVEGSWNWGEQALPRLSKYTYLGVDFTSNGAWDEHVKEFCRMAGKRLVKCIVLLAIGILT